MPNEKLERYGKASGPLMGHKKQMFTDNAAMLAKSDVQAEYYSSQPRRVVCKVCSSRLERSSFFAKGVKRVPYSICVDCGHHNGQFEDTSDYNERLYAEQSGGAYGKNYKPDSAEDFAKRVLDIYLPKAEFLLEAQPDLLERKRFLDIGCGSGHMAAALIEIGLPQVIGVDVGKSQIEIASTMVDRARFETVNFGDLPDFLSTYRPDFVSMIGVLEHLEDPRGVLRAIRNCNSIEGVFLSVPLYSLSVLIETAMPEVFPRQLSGGHTHLFTESSLLYVVEELLGFEVAAEWWFGTDIVDLFRALSVQIGPGNQLAVDELQRLLVPVIDELQVVLDQAHLCSEVHAVLRRPI